MIEINGNTTHSKCQSSFLWSFHFPTLWRSTKGDLIRNSIYTVQIIWMKIKSIPKDKTSLQCKRRKSIPCSAPAARRGPSQTCCVQSLAKGGWCLSTTLPKDSTGLKLAGEKRPDDQAGVLLLIYFSFKFYFLKCALSQQILHSLFLLLAS